MLLEVDAIIDTCSSFISFFSPSIFIYQDPFSVETPDSLAAVLHNAGKRTSSFLLLIAPLISFTASFTYIKETITVKHYNTIFLTVKSVYYEH